MAEKDTSREARAAGPELRLIDRRAFVGFPQLTLAPGVVVTDFALQIPDVTFPMNISGGATRYQKKKLDFGFLELSVDAEVIVRRLAELAGKLAELDELKLHFRPGYLEVQARLRAAERTPVTFKVAFDGDGERLAVYFYDVRFYGFSTTPAARLPAVVSEAIRELALLPDVERRGANGFSARILPAIVEQAAVARGYKMPSLDQARLAEASVSGKGLRLRFTAGGLPPPGTPDEELLLALEGARAFSDAEELLAQGKLKEARAAYLRLGDATEAHPFAVERLLTLLVADATAHELALDIAASLARRRERSATALWAEAVVRERRGESARAAERFLALSSLARSNHEEAGAFFAAEASARAARDQAPQMAVKALHEVLGLRPDHLPSLKALARASDQARDRAGAIRAYRRLAALARDPADAADAHVQLARLCAQTEDDVAGARLHCEAALRLAPDHPEALLQLGELCYRSGEHLRAVKALDRLREVAMGRHEVDRVGRANLLAGLVWETGLKQPENALLRFREAASMLPGEAEPLYLAARVADGLGRIQEAVSGYQQAIELAGPAPRTEEVRKAAHAAHHALARLLKTKLGEPARGREHLEAALGLDPTDTSALDELLPYFRASGKAVELADACEKAAAVSEDPHRRAALWAEAGELYRGRLAQPEKAERLLTQALEADPKNRIALEAMLALAEARRDGGQLCRCLRALAELTEEPRERVRHYRRLAVAARDLAFDLDLAVHAYREVLRVEPDDLPVLGELTTLERRRADMGGLAWALEQRARAAETIGDRRLAAAALRELGQVLDARLGRAADALVAMEKACRLHPEPNALLELAALSLRLERAVNARRALEDALALLPRHAPPEKLAEVRAKLGRACELLGDRDAARENYALAFPLRRLDDELAQRLEALYAEANLTRELTDLWAARAQALMQAGRAQDAAPLFFKSAQTLLKAGDTSGAILRLNAALDAAPSGERAAEALEAMAQLELERGEPGEAARLHARHAQLLDSPRESARWLFKAATLVRDTAREAPYLVQALEKDGTFVPARARRADLVEAAAPREAFADLEVVLNADPKDPDVVALGDRTALIRRAGFAALRSGQPDAARRLLAQYAAHRPGDVEAWQELAKLHRRAGAVESLVDLLGELWPRLEGAPRQAARREYAEGALTLGRTAAAVEALRSMLAEEPNDDWAAGKLLALLPADDTTTQERLGLLSRLVTAATGEERAELLARRAELHRVAGDVLAARADLLDAAQLSSRPVPLLRALAELARQSKDETAELAAWRLVLERSGRDEALQQDAADRLLTLARSRTAAGDHARAMEAWEGVVSLPLSPAERFEAWYGLAQTARAVGSLRRAEEALLEASRQGPAPRRVEALMERATLLEERGAREDAVTAWEGALALSPRHPGALHGLKRALRETGDWEGLAEVLAADASQTPRSKAAPLFLELADIYLERLAQPGPGEAALRRVIALDQTDVGARRRLAALLARRGEAVEAVQLLEEAAGQLDVAAAAPLLREGAALARQAADAELELRLMRRAHGLSPATGDDLERLAEALYLHGAVREALPLQQALARTVGFEDAPDVAERVLLRLADLAEQAGERGLAESSLRRVVQERPLNTRAVERLAALLEPTDARGALELLARHVEDLAPSPRSAERLHALARQANAELRDVDLAYRLYARAAELSDSPLRLRLEAANVLRQAGRTPELMGELLEVAQLHVAAGNVDAALEAWDEEARLAEGLGRIDEALRSLTAMAELCEDEARDAEAARFHVRRAELLRDSKLDLDAAAQALEKAWILDRSPATASSAMTLARRRGDRESEIDWLERSLAGVAAPAEKATAFVQLARLHLGLPAEGGAVSSAPLLAPEQAEAALKQALRFDPRVPEGETMLLALYERLDRVGDIAAHYEEAAAQAPDVARRAELLLRAAELYKDRAGRPHDAAAALLAARAANPDDAGLTGRVADSLHELGRHQEAADFDAVLLEADPFHRAFERHRAWLEQTGDALALAGLLSQRAERQEGGDAARTWLEAAAAFHRAGADERAQLCEAQAFEASPENREAFELLLSRSGGDARRQAELLAQRARAVPAEGSALLRRRAELLTAAGEALLAASAWDDYLELVPDELAALEARAELAAQGGPRAAQPWDRRLVQVGGELLPPALRLKTWVRLGQAALEAQAWRDAVDAFEAALAVDPTGPRSDEVLSFLSEAWGRLRDPAGQYRTTVRLAQRASGAEAEALFRRALSFVDEAAQGIEALEPLLARHPGDAELYEKGAQALRALGRLGDLVQLHERYASVVGGARAAQALLDAAAVVETDLRDAQRAFELRQEASRADPHNQAAAEAVLVESRRRGDTRTVVEQLRRLVPLVSDEAAAAELRLELAGLLEQQGALDDAKAVLAGLRAAGPSGSGYAQALASLERLAVAQGDDVAVGELRLAMAELLGARERAARLLEAARSFQRAGAPERAIGVTREALAAHASRDGFELLVELARAAGQPATAAGALAQLAGETSGAERARLWLEAADAWEAAGEAGEATAALERVLAERAGSLSDAAAAARFLRLGSPQRALEVGFAPAMRSGDLAAALALAEAAGDRARQREALWALAPADAAAAARLAGELRAERDVGGLERLAGVYEGAGDVEQALALWRELLFSFEQRAALEALEARGVIEVVLADAIAQPALPVLRWLLPRTALPPEQREQLLVTAAQLLPDQRPTALRELASLRVSVGRGAAAAEALAELASLEEDPHARAALQVERGELLLREQDLSGAKAAFERALADDATLVAAVRALVELWRDTPERFVAMVERLQALAGEDAVTPYRAALADAYEGLGRTRDAYQLLGTLEETEALVRRRVALATALGLGGEALVLREKVATTPAELEEILQGYLLADLVPFAVRLGERLLGAGTLSQQALRLMAERLAAHQQGAALAVRAWPLLLRARVADADGWTLFGEALRRLDRADAAVVADGFGAALTASTAVAPMVQPRPLIVPPAGPFGEVVVDLLPVSPETMPRLTAAIGEALEGFGARETRVYLDPAGGVEAWLLSARALVIGAGALSTFAPSELIWLLALAVALGERGRQLRELGEVDDLAAAAVVAFEAWPSSLAAARVLGHVDARVRGGDPRLVDQAVLLPDNEAFQAVARRALELLAS